MRFCCLSKQHQQKGFDNNYIMKKNLYKVVEIASILFNIISKYFDYSKVCMMSDMYDQNEGNSHSRLCQRSMTKDQNHFCNTIDH